jgi:hypothetical protein
MNGQFRGSHWIAAAFAVLVAVGVAVLAYQAGVSHGLALQIPSGSAAPVYPPYYWYRPWGFGFIGPIFFFVIFWIFISRLLFWGGRRRWHRVYGYDGPPYFEEWHRRAHERMNERPSSSSPTSA